MKQFTASAHVFVVAQQKEGRAFFLQTECGAVESSRQSEVSALRLIGGSTSVTTAMAEEKDCAVPELQVRRCQKQSIDFTAWHV